MARARKHRLFPVALSLQAAAESIQAPVRLLREFAYSGESEARALPGNRIESTVARLVFMVGRPSPEQQDGDGTRAKLMTPTNKRSSTPLTATSCSACSGQAGAQGQAASRRDPLLHDVRDATSEDHQRRNHAFDSDLAEGVDEVIARMPLGSRRKYGPAIAERERVEQEALQGSVAARGGAMWKRFFAQAGGNERLGHAAYREWCDTNKAKPGLKAAVEVARQAVGELDEPPICSRSVPARTHRAPKDGT